MKTDPGINNKNFNTFEAIDMDEMDKWIEKNLHKFWEINIERFPSGAVIVKFRWTKEAEEEFRGKKGVSKPVTATYIEDDL